MFPIIPQYFAKKPPVDQCVTSFTSAVQSVQIQKPTDLYKTYEKITNKLKVTVSSTIEKDTVSEAILVRDILDENHKNIVEEIKVYSRGNKLKCNSTSWSWLKHVHLAEDCHSYNVELYKSAPDSNLIIKAVRKILPNEKLVLWFSRELLITLQIPYLSLSNIQGEKQYICHECPFQCEMPNPLKIHLSLECGKLSKQHLWRRLPLDQDQMSFIPHTTVVQANKPINATISTTEVKMVESKSSSAFKPYKKQSKVDGIKDEKRLENDKLSKICSVLPNVLLNQNISDINERGFFYKQAVEMETIVSNLGRFKQGHLCIYCGKVYSRKYGLKIHIRTHTGFKPLKCKYCLRPFGDPSNLNKHVRLHSEGDTPYKCDRCGKILVRKRDLDRHIKSRH